MLQPSIGDYALGSPENDRTDVFTRRLKRSSLFRISNRHEIAYRSEAIMS